MMLKKFLLMFMVMVMAASAAQAGGLSGLIGGSTGGISDLYEKDVSLPDPFTVLEEEGSVMRENYEFMTGYFCTVYQYPTPRSSGHFISEYTPVAKENGYSVTEVNLPEFDGYEGCAVQNGDGKTAYLIFDIQGDMLFLVENGMDYEPAMGNSITVEYAGTTYHGPATIYHPDSFDSISIQFCCGDASSDYIYLDLPQNVEAGKEYYYTDGKQMYRENLNLKIGRMRMYDAMSGSKDYFRVVIERYEEVDGHIHISGTIEGTTYGNRNTIKGTFSCMTEHCMVL